MLVAVGNLSAVAQAVAVLAAGAGGWPALAGREEVAVLARPAGGVRCGVLAPTHAPTHACALVPRLEERGPNLFGGLDRGDHV